MRAGYVIETLQVFYFVRFDSNKTREAVEFIANNGMNQSLRRLPCTGGGAHKVRIRVTIDNFC